MFYVYEHWRPDRDEPFYVGKGKGRRANLMARRNIHHRAIQLKLQRLGMAVEVKIIASGLSEQEAFEIEVQRIKMWKDAGIDLANKSEGGEGNSGHIGLRGNKSPNFGKPSIFKGKKHTEETKKILSEKASNRLTHPMRGKHHTDETKDKIRAKALGRPSAFKGRKHSYESINKMSNSLTGLMVGELNPFFGKKHSDASKEKMSLSLSGENHPRFGKKDSEEVKLNKSEGAKLGWLKRKGLVS